MIAYFHGDWVNLTSDFEGNNMIIRNNFGLLLKDEIDEGATIRRGADASDRDWNDALSLIKN